MIFLFDGVEESPREKLRAMERLICCLVLNRKTAALWMYVRGGILLQGAERAGSLFRIALSKSGNERPRQTPGTQCDCRLEPGLIYTPRPASPSVILGTLLPSRCGAPTSLQELAKS